VANKCEKVYESNIPWLMAGRSGHDSHTPEWQWQRARQAGMHGRRGNSHYGMAKEPGSAKHAGRMCTSLVGKCWREPGQAKFFEGQEKLIKVKAK